MDTKYKENSMEYNSLITAQSSAEKKTADININRKDGTIVLTAGAAIALLYTVCFGGAEVLPQLSFVIFCPFAFIVLTILLNYLGYLKNNKAMIWAVPIFIIAAFNGIFSINIFTYGNVIAMHFLFACFVFSAMREQSFDLFNMSSLIRLIKIMFGNWLVAFDIVKIINSSKQGCSRDKDGIKIIMKILLGVLLSVPVLFIITALLISADMVFSKLVEGFVDGFISFSFINMSHILTFIAVWVFVIGYMFHSKKVSESKNSIVMPVLRVDIIICSTFLVMVNLLFLTFSVIQIAYLFGGGFMELPEDMIYSQYAREGFFQLLFVTVINFSVIFTFVNVLKGTAESKLLRLLLLTLCLFTGVLIASSFYRMYLYIEVYGHTMLRLCVITFLVMEVFLIFISVSKLVNDKIPFAKLFVMTVFIFYMIVNITGSEYFAMRLNMNMFLSGRLESLDVRSLGADGLSAVMPLIEDGQYICVDYQIIKKNNMADYSSMSVQNPEDLIPDLWTDRSRWQNKTLFGS